MAAKTKTELLEITDKELKKLINLIAPISDEMALVKDQDDTSIKDVVAHRAHWIELYLGWYADGQAGKPVYFPAQGYKWNDLKRYNSNLRKQQADLGWGAARTLLGDRHKALRDFLNSRSETELYGGPMRGANNNWTAGRWAEAAGPSHYRSAAKYIRAVLRNKKAPAPNTLGP
ncbi:ClbS/DfsB family four-helix bundle protein [Cognatishimia sp. WU-CL00825]|uniref:ClbS/DfsB family four-helix bundle protein n=1 Tax=Cognatishimia sp. WU-CL00825 TaxID=3127658 RepID=UPI003109C11D